MSEEPRRLLDGGGEQDERAARFLLESFESAPPPGARAHVWARVSTPSRRGPIAIFGISAAAVAAGLAFGLFSWQGSRPSIPEVPAVAPLAEPTSAARTVREPSHEPIVIPGHVTVNTGSGARVRVRHTTPPVELQLDEGSISLELVETSNSPVIVLAGPWTASAAGRGFAMEWVGGRLSVDATRALVRIEGPTNVTLERGSRFDSHSGGPAKVSTETKAPVVKPRERLAPVDRPEEGQRELYERAKESSGRQAIVLFDRAAAREGPLTELALYQAARLELTGGRASDALARFQALQRRFPSGTLARETDLSSIECELELGDLEMARRELDRYLSRYPDTERQSELRFLRGELHRKLGDCERAHRDYAAVREGSRLEDALYLTAWCADRIGLGEEAKQSLGEYLRLFPSGRHSAAARGYLSAGRWSEKNP